MSSRRAWHELPPPNYGRDPDDRAAIETAWQRHPPALPGPSHQTPPSPIPPWGATGGGHYQLLPPQDRRFGEAGAEGQSKPGQGYLLE